jgi:beta-phosphoglucomutase-like phosphatase (HAD superfamily)
VGPEHFDDELHRHARSYLLKQETAADAELTALLAELYALGDEEEITLETASQLLLRLRERGLQRELASADGERLVELQQTLAKLRDEIRAFA